MRKKGSNAAIAIKDPIALKRVQNYLKTHNYKAYILFMIGLGTGYRGGDLISLTVGRIREAVSCGELIVKEHKTENSRKIPFERSAYLNDKLINILEEYIKDKDDAQFIYWSQKGKGEGVYRENVTRAHLGTIFKEAAVACGVSKISIGTHTPRKTYGYIQFLENDKDIYFVQELFGHSSPRITMAYIGIDDDMFRKSAKIINKYM